MYTKEDHLETMKTATSFGNPFNSELICEKTIHNWRARTPAEIKKSLHMEVEHLGRTHKDYQLDSFSKPVERADGSIVYQIKLIKI